MARLVKRFRGTPYAVTVGGESQYICGCGLSATQPFCDGTHKITQGEEPQKLYWYDEEGQRHAAEDSYPDIRDDKQTQNA
ncbi:MAG TPA: CDGSH iron-sulfur domain-containing protein [Burkholderiales bacterium]|nr:CDGSH iron-sulfur domain-containing protein [Burkholderiales bacterium]